MSVLLHSQYDCAGNFIIPSPTLAPEDPCNPNESGLTFNSTAPCENINNNIFIIRTHAHIFNMDDGLGGQNIEYIEENFETLRTAFASYNIFFSFEDLDYINNTDLFEFQLDLGVPANDDRIDLQIEPSNKDNRIDIYFAGPGQFPNASISNLSPLASGVIIGDGLSSTCNGEVFTQINTLAHEMGHAFGLWHTFQYYNDSQNPNLEELLDGSNACVAGDYVGDTPTDPNSHNCNIEIDINGNCTYNEPCNGVSGHQPPLYNIMAYSCLCRQEFTPEQVGRMKRFLSNCGTISGVVQDDEIVYVGYDRVWSHSATEGTLSCYPSIVVRSGATLTLQTDLKMQSSQSIRVEPGGKLIIDGAKITSCDGETWEGIIVEGNSNLPQTISAQGKVIFQNGAIVENAVQAIQVESGGYVQATDANFINNQAGVNFEPYQFQSFSSFLDCVFTVNDEMDEAVPFTEHLKLSTSNGIAFAITNCDFKNERTGATEVEELGRGIKAFDARFIVSDNCNFEGLYAGIETSFLQEAQYFSIKESNFTNNMIGVLALGSNNYFIRDNVFNIGGFNGAPLPPDDMHVGLEIESGTGFNVNLNAFLGEEGTEKTIGILVEDTGGESNLINGNTFDWLEKANQAQGTNVEIDDGLQYWCNTNLGNNVYDFFVTGVGIASSQGGGLAVRNTFSLNSFPEDSDFENESDVFINYFHFDVTTENPSNYPEDKILLIPVTNPEGSVDCPELEEGGGPIIFEDPPTPMPDDDLVFVKSIFDNSKDNFKTAKENLQSILDGGDKTSLLNELVTLDTESVGDMEQELLAISPYLTTEVLEAVVNRQDVFSVQAIADVLSANPDELRKPSLQQFLNAHLPPATVTNILANVNQITSRTNLVNEITQYANEMYRMAGLIIRNTFRESGDLKIDSLRTWLLHKDSYEGEIERLFTYLNEGDTGTINQILAALPTQYNLDADALTELVHLSNLITLYLNAQSAGTSMFELAPAEVSTIQDIAENSEGIAGAKARSLMNFAYRSHYRVIPAQPQQTEQSQSMMMPNHGMSANSSLNHTLSVYPNPARNEVTFEYEFSDFVVSSQIIVQDFYSKTITSFELEDKNGKVVWNTGFVQNGIYWLYLFKDGELDSVQKLVIIK